MWQADLCVEPGWPTGVGNTLRYFPWFRRSREVLPPPRPPRAIRSHHHWSWQDRLAYNAWWGPPQLRVTVAGVPDFLAISER